MSSMRLSFDYGDIVQSLYTTRHLAHSQWQQNLPMEPLKSRA